MYNLMSRCQHAFRILRIKAQLKGEKSSVCMQVCRALHPKYGGDPSAELGEIAAKLSRAKVPLVHQVPQDMPAMWLRSSHML